MCGRWAASWPSSCLVNHSSRENQVLTSLSRSLRCLAHRLGKWFIRWILTTVNLSFLKSKHTPGRRCSDHAHPQMRLTWLTGCLFTTQRGVWPRSKRFSINFSMSWESKLPGYRMEIHYRHCLTLRLKKLKNRLLKTSRNWYHRGTRTRRKVNKTDTLNALIF